MSLNRKVGTKELVITVVGLLSLFAGIFIYEATDHRWIAYCLLGIAALFATIFRKWK